MKWRDIPQFTPDAAWHADFPLFKDFIWWITDEIYAGLQLNPDFQRGHVWTTEQQESYIEFILMGGKTGKNFYFNAPNWPEIREGDNYVCVDGLQRITAIQRFHNNEIKAFGNYHKDFTGPVRLDQWVSVYINNLKTRKDVLKWYIEMNSGGTPHTKEELERVKQLLLDC